MFCMKKYKHDQFCLVSDGNDNESVAIRQCTNQDVSGTHLLREPVLRFVALGRPAADGSDESLAIE